jgi:iron complex outermembrane receptor protein
MTRSRRRKLQFESTATRKRSLGPPVTVACAVLAALPGVSRAEGATPEGGLEEIVVTAQKRSESLQDVPLSIMALGTARLEQLHVQNFADYARMLPSVSFQGGGQGFGPGFNRVYMRGVAAGDNGNHSGPRPSVGMYLDEQPVTTIQGALDIHVYDIARVESLAGPQGTLYGASSQAGTVRLITNKPDPSGFKAGYDLEGNYTQHGAGGYVGEGFVNLPINDAAALRVVGWTEHVPGYIDNVRGTLTYPSTDITIDNAARVRKHYNDTDTTGARAALKVDLNDSWTVTPAIMAQDTQTHGSFGYDPSLGDLKVAHFHPESTADRWYQAALTVEGKISNFDIVYAGAYLHRHDETQQDYADYSFFYDSCCLYWNSETIFDNAGNAIDPTQYIYGRDGYRSQSHELRISSPKDRRFRFVAGLFYQRQQHDIEQRYVINNLATSLEVTYWPDVWWLTEQRRVDRDTAAFTEANFDITDKLTLTGGIRFFEAKNSLRGFYGFGLTNGFTSATGEKSCISAVRVNGGPCTNLDKQVTESGNTPKVNLSYKFSPDHMVYATWSKGFRPGGSNRRDRALGVTLPPYKADFIENYELGWKTSWLDKRLRFNGAVFQENWNDFQFSYLGANALTEIRNAGSAKIRGLEATVDWAATSALTVTAGATLIDAKLTADFCKNLDANGVPLPRGTCPADSFAPDGTRLPVTSKIKSNLSGRYTFAVAGYESYVQGTVSYQGSAPSTLIPNERRYLVDQRGYAIADLSAGLQGDRWTVGLYVDNLFDKRADVYRFAQCPVFQPGTGDATPFSATFLCGGRTYIQTNLPRTIGIRFGQKF